MHHALGRPYRYYVTYASGCCGCKGGSIVWVYRAEHPLGPWVEQGSVTPGGPVTRAQQRAVVRVAAPVSTAAPDGWVCMPRPS